MRTGQYPMELLAGNAESPCRFGNREVKAFQYVFTQDFSGMRRRSFQWAFYCIISHILALVILFEINLKTHCCLIQNIQATKGSRVQILSHLSGVTAFKQFRKSFVLKALDHVTSVT